VIYFQKRKKLLKKLSLIFITPYGAKSIKQFEEVKNKIGLSMVHVFWKEDDYEEDSLETEDRNSNTILFILKEILKDESEGKIEAIDEYTKHTIKSFITFISNDFKSTIEEELEGDLKRDIIYDVDRFMEKYSSELNQNSLSLVKNFTKYIQKNHKNLICRHSRNHPVSIMVNEKSGKIFSLSKSGRGLIIQLVYKHHPLSSDIIDNIISLLIADTFITQNGDRTITVKKESDLTAIDIEKIFSLFISKIQL